MNDEELCSIASACTLPDGHEGAHDYMLISESLGEPEGTIINRITADVTARVQAAIDAASTPCNAR